MRVAVVHNLPPGGAHRRLAAHVAGLRADVVELCLSSAMPIRDDAHVVSVRQRACAVPRPLRIPFRYSDLAALLVAWRTIAVRVAELQVDAVYANPCTYLQAPPALRRPLPPTLYFCDEPRRVDSEAAAHAARNKLTLPIYALMYGVQRHNDRRAVARATRLATNSRFTAGEIERVYGRSADVIPMGVPDLFRGVAPCAPAHLLSVGSMIPSKGHDLVIEAAGRARTRRPVIVVAPRFEDPAEQERLHALAARVGVALEIRTAISDAQLADAYAAAHATLYMAVREPFGLVSLEAQAAGSPVVVSAEGGLPETIVEGRTGWAVPRAAGPVADRLDALDDSTLRTAMAAAAREHAATATWARSARAIEDILMELCQ